MLLCGVCRMCCFAVLLLDFMLGLCANRCVCRFCGFIVVLLVTVFSEFVGGFSGFGTVLVLYLVRFDFLLFLLGVYFGVLCLLFLCLIVLLLVLLLALLVFGGLIWWFGCVLCCVCGFFEAGNWCLVGAFCGFWGSDTEIPVQS